MIEKNDSGAIVLGAAGYIGRALTRQMALKMPTLGVDCSNQPSHGDYLQLNLEADDAPDRILARLPHKKISFVYHCAGFFPKLESEREGLTADHFKTDFLVQKNAFGVAERLNAVFVNLSGLPVGRDDETGWSVPLRSYFEAKRVSEAYILERRANVAAVRILRLPRVVGLGDGRYDGLPPDLISKFVLALAAGDRLEVSRPGVRVPYLYLPDLVEFLTDSNGAGADTTILELGSPDAISVWETFSLVRALVNHAGNANIVINEEDKGILLPPAASPIGRSAHDVVRLAAGQYVRELSNNIRQ